LLAPAPGNAAQQGDPEAALRLFADAERLAGEGDLQAALRNYELLVQQFPRAAIADDALLRTAEGRWQLGDRAAAEEAIATLEEDYARTASAAGAFVLAGNIRMATSNSPADFEAAREQFRSVVLLYGRDDFPSLPWRVRALVRAGEASVALDEPEAAAAHFVAAIEDEPHSELTEVARLQLGTVLMRSGEWQAAAEILQRIIDESAAEGDSHAAGPEPAVRARRFLQLIYRLQLRPSLSQPPWERAAQLRFTGPQLDEPVGIAARGERAVMVDPGIPLIAIVEPDGTLSSRVPSSESSHPWWGRGGDPYAATRRSVLDVGTRQRQDFSAPDGDEMKPLEEITAGAHGIHRQWFVLDSNRRAVLMYDDNAEYISTLIGDDDSEPVDVAVDHLGRLYVLDRRAEAVFRFSPEGGDRTRVLQRDWRRPEALAIDALDNIYVLDRDAKTVEVFDGAGQLIWQAGPQLPGGIELRSPRDISVADDGRIYIADRDAKIFLVIE
jgi:outer membrane protein assembly factor BamD (BamD/ComL family)